MSLSPTLETYLSDRGARYTLEQHAASVTSRDTARMARIDEQSLAKSVVLVDELGYVLLAVLPASRRLELTELRARLGRALRLAREEDMEALFPDCALGAVPALGAAFGLPTILDSSLEESEEIFFEAGDHETLVHMSVREFLELQGNASRARIAIENKALEAARGTRLQLYESFLALSDAIAAPVGDESRWRARLAHEIVRLLEALEGHVRETEGCEGLLDEIVEQAPRLAREVERLRKEHEELRNACIRTLARVEEYASTEAIRQAVVRLLTRLVRHRHRGADAVYEAFEVDIGGG